jgi:hypothetical protein
MEKEQTLEFIKLVHHTYNTGLARKDEPDIARAWHMYIQDLPYEDVLPAFIELSMESQFMPKPMDVRKAAKDRGTKIPKPELPNLAWATFQTLIKNANNGNHTPIPIHECLQLCLKRLGDTAYTMHDQYDKKRFEAVYEECVREYEKEKYKI